MHILFVEKHGLEETAIATDLDQSPADLVVLSFSDSDLGAFAEGWRLAKKNNSANFPTLRLANLAALQHPLSVDVYIEKTLEHAKAILIRLIGGVPYWTYGLNRLKEISGGKQIALAVLPADGRPDPGLDSYSTVPISTTRRLTELCDAGGPIAASAALSQLALASGFYAKPVPGIKVVPNHGIWTPENGICEANEILYSERKPTILITFYRSYLVSADLKPITCLFRSLRKRGFRVVGIFVPSLKDLGSSKWLKNQISGLEPAAIINATAFSGRSQDQHSPLDIGGQPVFQIALSTGDQESWENSNRGLSPGDMAMHVVLPEVDGRLFAGVASFKQSSETDNDLEFSRMAHEPNLERIEAISEKVSKWVQLQTRPIEEAKTVFVLSNYPGKPWQMAHAVGLDALASAEAMLFDLGQSKRDDGSSLAKELIQGSIHWSLTDYLAALGTIPQKLKNDLNSVWGAPEEDRCYKNGGFSFKAIWRGNILVAVQPERGLSKDRTETYHDLSRVPCHSYVAFYLWIRLKMNRDSLVHIGAHGTLEWLPGKAVALSESCWPEALIGSIPVIYPFIVNDPGEAAQAKRRIGALTIGHIPPTITNSEIPQKFSSIESLLDEFSNADGLDPKRRDRLIKDIKAEADNLGISKDLNLNERTSKSDALLQIDRFVCDIKESQFTEGLHTFGRKPKTNQNKFEIDNSINAERKSLIDSLSGKRIDAGPAGSPYRGRTDVLPTGRNLFATDPLSVPSKSAYQQGIKIAEEFLRNHLQINGDWPTNVMIDLWGSATMRTAGEEFSMALQLIGIKPIWSKNSERVEGFEVIPHAILDRPRIDVTLRVSGLFRDIFPTLVKLYNQAVRTLSKRDESVDINPYIKASNTARVYGPAPGQFGIELGDIVEDYTDMGQAAAAEAWIKGSAWALSDNAANKDEQGIRELVSNVDSFIHLQDLKETDLLQSMDYASHQGGFVSANKMLGGSAKSYHIDNTSPEKPQVRTLSEEIARVVYARASNPTWIRGMTQHGFRGASEVAATLEHMAAFAQLAGVVGAHLFDEYYSATLGNAEVLAFLGETNPDALEAMRERFRSLFEAGIWKTRINSALAAIGEET